MERRLGVVILNLTVYNRSHAHNSSGVCDPVSTDRVVTIKSTLKLGNFSLSFSDLEVPVAGFPITVSRTYDALRASQPGDLEYGWKLNLARGRPLFFGKSRYCPRLPAKWAERGKTAENLGKDGLFGGSSAFLIIPWL